MRFDEWWDWDEQGGRPDGGGHLQKLPDGIHTGDIVKAEFKRLSFKKADDNPDGTSLVVTWSKDGYYPVESIVSIRWRGLIEAICRAAGVTPPRRGEEWDEQSLVGRTATIEVEMAVARSGNEYLRVSKWHSSPQQPLPEPIAKAPAKRPARTPAATAHQEFNANAPDDIPF